MSADLDKWTKKIGVEYPVQLLQKDSLLETKKIIRRVFCV